MGIKREIEWDGNEEESEVGIKAENEKRNEDIEERERE